MEWEYVRRLLALIALILNLARLLTYSTVATWVKKRLKSASVSMPWNIPPALLVLWSVVWMFAPRPGPEQYVSVSDNLEGNAPLDNFHIDLNFGTYQLQGAAEPPLTCWTTRLTDEEMACIYPSTTDQPLRSFSLVPMEYREPASYSILPTKDSLGGFSSQPSISPSTERQATAVAPPQAQVISPGNSAAVAPHQTQAISSSNSTASKDFSCPRCGTLFGRRDNMSRHMKNPALAGLYQHPL
ncbi:unnamed protein product [Parascedosporium putredinis]|uniref:C2H2-type domain-containing protein n=1 Tax=Parascedosporium putredinis TaxID=1442378 RepID=A0A9P1GZY0_9PEZI|nr:unnamed protein product [Parascedosporium putredinis]CAI7991207.1 unnamed protein product [Parascedosporium putredinis]